MPKPDHTDTQDCIVCPYCFHVHTDIWDWSDDFHQCHRGYCEKTFALESYAVRFCTTFKATTCPTCAQTVKIDEKGRQELHSRLEAKNYVRCEGSRQPAKEV